MALTAGRARLRIEFLRGGLGPFEQSTSDPLCLRLEASGSQRCRCHFDSTANVSHRGGDVRWRHVGTIGIEEALDSVCTVRCDLKVVELAGRFASSGRNGPVHRVVDSNIGSAGRRSPSRRFRRPLGPAKPGSRGRSRRDTAPRRHLESLCREPKLCWVVGGSREPRRGTCEGVAQRSRPSSECR